MRALGAASVLTATLLVGGAPAAHAAANAFTIKLLAAPGTVLDVAGGSTSPTAPITNYPADGGSNQQWTLLPAGNLYMLENDASDECVIVAGIDASVTQGLCIATQSDTFQLTATPALYAAETFYNPSTQTYLYIANAAPYNGGYSLQAWQGGPGWPDQFELSTLPGIVSSETYLEMPCSSCVNGQGEYSGVGVLDVSGANVAPGTPLDLWSVDDPASLNQEWAIYNEGANNVEIISYLDDQCVTGTGTSGTTLATEPCVTGELQQLWNLPWTALPGPMLSDVSPNYNGLYLCMEAYGGASQGARIDTWKYNATSNQLWWKWTP